jgi:tetratricopeptide (TPR) repeat protein
MLGLLETADAGAAVGAEATEDRDEQETAAADQDSPPRGSNGRYEGASKEWVEELVARKLNSILSADYYAVLDVDRITPTSRITTVYREMRETFESFRSRWAGHNDLARNLDSLMLKIDEAYDTLGNPEKRSAYDRPPDARVKSRPHRSNARNGTAASNPQPQSSGFAADYRNPEDFTPNIDDGSAFDPLPMAADHFRRGRARFDQSDFHTCVHHFREAARLDPSKTDHHYYLAVTLSILAQARHTRHSHTHDIGSHVTCTLGGGLARNPRLRHEAEQHLLMALELDRKNPDITLRLARLYQDAGMENKANHYFLETLMLDASNATALRELGLNYKKEKPPSSPKRATRESARR